MYHLNSKIFITLNKEKRHYFSSKMFVFSVIGSLFLLVLLNHWYHIDFIYLFLPFAFYYQCSNKNLLPLRKEEDFVSLSAQKWGRIEKKSLVFNRS